MKLYHNPRCQKSRETLALLEEKGLAFEIVLYMTEPLLPNDIEQLLAKLDIDAIDLIRTSEKIWKEELKDLELHEDELILMMIEHPQLMQRPILENGEKAAIGRPPKKVLEIL